MDGVSTVGMTMVASDMVTMDVRAVHPASMVKLLLVSENHTITVSIEPFT